jgi:hypothetical protein
MNIRLFVMLLLGALQINAQALRTIKLNDQKAEYAVKSFYIASVIDDRDDKAIIGTIRAGLTNRKINLNLQGGATEATTVYIEKNVQQNTNTTPVNMHIKQLLVHEKEDGFAEQVVVEISIGYYLHDQLLIEYTGNASQRTSIDATMYIEGLIRKNINETLTRFDEWWATHKNQYSSTGKMIATNVKVSVMEGSANGDRSLVLFDTRRLLTLNDFKGEPDDQNPGAAAVTYSGITVGFNSQTQDGRAVVNVVVTPTFSITKSWCRTNSRNARTLNHEQMHFNLTGLKACELMAAIKNYAFTPEHYEQELDALREKSLKELDAEQNLYDKQTNHGLITAEQNKWNKDITKRTLEQACY